MIKIRCGMLFSKIKGTLVPFIYLNLFVVSFKSATLGTGKILRKVIPVAF